MCGFVVVVGAPGRLGDGALRSATDSLRHRGPDDSGLLSVRAGEHLQLDMGHRRLSILDLTTAGHQPMVRPGRGAIVFNGEVYDHRALRDALADRWQFESRSDTETLLAGVLEEGPELIARANAMLAAVIWDERRSRLVIARDRLGKKPLYVYRGSGVLAFASELKAFHALGLPMSLDPTALAYFRWLNYVPGPGTAYRECTKFPPGSWSTVDLTAREPQLAPPRQFWDPLAALGRRPSVSYARAKEELSELIDDATKLRLEADAPVGIFLSGGIDSTLVASSTVRAGVEGITTFVVKPEVAADDESGHAAATARALGLDLVALDLPRASYKKQIERVATHFDDPCAPLSQLALMALSEAASAHAKVVLTGDGGDEVFLGYPWVGHTERLWRLAAPLRRVPALGGAARGVIRSPLGRATVGLAARLLRLRTDNVDEKLGVVTRALESTHPVSIHEEFLTVVPRGQLSTADRALIGDESLLDRLERWYPAYSWDALAERSIPEVLAAVDLVLDMRDHILVKTDRATMAYGIEARSPLLDYRIVEYGMSLPVHYKRGPSGRTKQILRDLCSDRVGSKIANRPKRGFGIPLPDATPEGMSTAARWNASFESAWRARWEPAASTHSLLDTPTAP